MGQGTLGFIHIPRMSAGLLETQPYFLAFYFLTWLMLKVVRHAKLKWDHGNLLSPPGILCEFPILELSLFLSLHMLPYRLELSNLLAMGNTESICQVQKSTQHPSPIQEQRLLLVIKVGSSGKRLHTETSFVTLQITALLQEGLLWVL